MRSETPSALITAMSVSGSVPTTLAFLVVPSLKFTVIEPLSPAPATTWLLVRISPSLLSTMPEPEPAPDWPETLTLTTEGSTALRDLLDGAVLDARRSWWPRTCPEVPVDVLDAVVGEGVERRGATDARGAAEDEGADEHERRSVRGRARLGRRRLRVGLRIALGVRRR